MAPLLKICGLRQVDQAVAVARLGVDAIGVIGVRASPRWVPPAERSTLFASIAQAAPACRRVLVLADPSEQQLADLGCGSEAMGDGGGPTVVGGGPTVLQLHGSETPQRCGSLRAQLPGLELWKALRLRQPDDLARAQAYAGVVDALLLDAWVPDQLGGTGHRIPLDWLVGFEPALPWWLAGGIRADRIAAVHRALCPTGLDASSGVERAPGDKDLAAVEALVAAVRLWPNGRR